MIGIKVLNLHMQTIYISDFSDFKAFSFEKIACSYVLVFSGILFAARSIKFIPEHTSTLIGQRMLLNLLSSLMGTYL